MLLPILTKPWKDYEAQDWKYSHYEEYLHFITLFHFSFFWYRLIWCPFRSLLITCHEIPCTFTLHCPANAGVGLSENTMFQCQIAWRWNSCSVITNSVLHKLWFLSKINTRSLICQTICLERTGHIFQKDSRQTLLSNFSIIYTLLV